ncbi:MAG: NAD(P)(+) transhydrogenase (Re/Si-specific) subunit beta [Chloroflexi bacterium]|nr:NAD(P)(+) transhydrogenase (Re/Si-specific) subunit beta [Chloroflexota bacterium]
MIAASAVPVDLAYLLAVAAFILGIKRLGSPATARSGNQVAAVGMAFAVIATAAGEHLQNGLLLLVGVIVGGVIGAAAARLVKITAMPQMVALFNGMGGGAAALIAMGDYRHLAQTVAVPPVGSVATATLSCIIGSISFSGSLIAFAKLQELLPGRPLLYRGQRLGNLLLLLAILVLGAIFAVPDRSTALLLLLIVLGTLLFGVLLVLPIGGADMPVVIALLNACTGLAAAVTGFLLDNTVLIVAGALVGASGTILTQAMSRAMHRSIPNIVLGGFGAMTPGAGPSTAATGTVRSALPPDVAVLLAYAREVIIVPGYGLAVAHAQHEVKELATLLQQRGVTVKYAIHPVAGRMPGHMNVLLAEADVPYTQLYEMEQINPEFSHCDVALVVGANDITNPAARTNRASPLYGMPILNVDQTANVVVLKRSMAPGFAGIDNELYVNPKTLMLFGDARESLLKLIAEVKQV